MSIIWHYLSPTTWNPQDWVHINEKVEVVLVGKNQTFKAMHVRKKRTAATTKYFSLLRVNLNIVWTTLFRMT